MGQFLMPHIDRRSLLAGSLSAPFIAISSAEAAKPGDISHWQLRPTIYSDTDRWSMSERMKHHAVPGVAIGVIRQGRVDSIEGFGTRIAGKKAPIGPNTLFSVGSISKVATALLCLRLVSRGILDLDTDVNRWLKRWRVPAGPPGDLGAVTLRMLLSHTSGFNVHGFEDYLPGAALPTLVQTLRGDSPAMNRPLVRTDTAGTRSRYSGGGYMIVQAVIEDVTGDPFATVAQREIFGPLDMRRSQFAASPADDIVNIAHAHDGKGQPAALPRGWQSFPELAASGLWTTAEDLARMVIAIGASYRRSDGFLPQDLSTEMMTTVTPGFNGLGFRLAGEGAARIFHHAGANDSYKAYIEGNLAEGDGLVILTNGTHGDVLGDEIRNAVSDALNWPGDWSVRVNPVPETAWIDDYVGQYRRRDGQAPSVTGFLDTGFSPETLEVLRSGKKLELLARGRNRSLVPVDTSTYAMPDAYVPAATLLFRFDRSADRRVKALRVKAGNDTMFFDRI
ncbi:beta-lactamase family protein [Sphingobium sp. BYY-5]|uniref:serine hydrolase domain-containing protein n=1 Tax=Sphingobium sp. BYY-5 TaxID=2926400 RepID=UPI001FA7D4F6|nr:serine hydrolase domain-containing protein [Sphingobium sp. BYY-5]MCI4592283.1 beta-lactamase family protein [Sphingobium sp. BYY-5]